MTNSVSHVAVYGSLRQGMYANGKMRDCELIGTERIKGDMYTLGAFPGVKLNTLNSFTVEVYRIPDNQHAEILAALDSYEGYHEKYADQSLYIRKVVDIKGTACYIYEINDQPPASARIYGGDWCNKPHSTVGGIHRGHD